MVGQYTIEGYENGRNDWHEVTITLNQDNRTFTWRNKAGVTWQLSPNAANLDEFEVGDNPYSEDGFDAMELIKSPDSEIPGTVAGVVGPYGERYLRNR